MNRRISWGGILSRALFVGVVLMTATTLIAASPKPNKTLWNLQKAYDGESNAHAKYVAFAEQADKEGYQGVASLFRAAARSEEIHMRNHADVIRKLGEEPRADIKTPKVKTTFQNLEESANKGEAYEENVMYPKFIKQAEKDSNPDAVQTFKFAKEAEAQHFILFHKALQNLESLRDSKVTYYVCSVCGFATDGPHGESCPDCGAMTESYETIR